MECILYYVCTRFLIVWSQPKCVCNTLSHTLYESCKCLQARHVCMSLCLCGRWGGGG